VSSFRPLEIGCGHCGERFVVQSIYSLNARRSPRLRERALAGTLQTFRCPGCGRPRVVEPTGPYLDLQRRQFFALFPADTFRYRSALVAFAARSCRENMIEFCAPMGREWAPTLKRRAIFGLERLREALLVDDAGLDDRLVEALKLQALRDLKPGAFDPRARLLFEGVGPGGALRMLHRAPAGTGGLEVEQSFSLPRRAYDRLAADREALAAAMPEIFEGWVVDWRAAILPDEPLPAAWTPDPLAGRPPPPG